VSGVLVTLARLGAVIVAVQLLDPLAALHFGFGARLREEEAEGGGDSGVDDVAVAGGEGGGGPS
jgi:hypothetical protein